MQAVTNEDARRRKRERIRRLLAFLPHFGPEGDGGVDADRAFLDLLSEEGWLLALDWRAWPSGADYLRRPESIMAADQEDLRRLLTLLAARAEAEPGFLRASGVRDAAASILCRLRELFPETPDPGYGEDR